MCEPISLTSAVAMGSLALSAGSAVMGMVQSGKQSEAAAQQQQAQAMQARQAAAAQQYQAAVARNAQTVAEWQAEDARKRGEIAETERRMKTRQQIGAQRAALASMGADINDGTAVDIVGDTAAVGEQDALTIRNNASREAYDRKMVAVNAGADATMADYGATSLYGRAASADRAASDIGANSWIGVGANLISGASSVADKWSMYKNKGVFG